MFFLILVFYPSFSEIFGILKGLFLVFWYSLPPSPLGRPWLTYYLLYKTLNKNMSVCLSVCLSVYGVTCPMKCSCNRIHQPLLSFYCRDVTFSTSIWYYYRDVKFSTLISFYYPDVTFSTLILSCYRDERFSTSISFYYRNAGAHLMGSCVMWLFHIDII